MTDAPDRRRFLRAVVVGGVPALAGCAEFSESGTSSTLKPTTGQSPERPTSTETPTDTPTETPAGDGLPVALDPVVEGIGIPTALAAPADRPSRLYVANRRGVVAAVDPDGLRAEPLLDLQESVMTGGERGFLGLALHPEFAANRRFFVRYSATPRRGTPSAFSHTTVVAEFTATGDGTRTVRGSGRTILEVPQPRETHNGGDLAFGPDGYLFVPTGDGGGASLGHADDWYDGPGPGNGQDTTQNLLGGVLRIDVDGEPTEHFRTDDGAPESPEGGGGYAIPDGNPLVGVEGHRDEYYAWGLRNPWRLSVDDGEVYVGDVGAARWESIYRVRRGGNYGWSVREGSHCFRTEDCPDETPPDVRGGEPLREPVIEYPNDRYRDVRVSGSAPVSGYHYRGSEIPGLEGTFAFADWEADGHLFGATPSEAGTWPVEIVEVVEPDRPTLHRVFGINRAGPDEWYVLTLASAGTGGVHRLVPGGEAD